MKIVFFGTSKYCLSVLEALKPQLKLVIVMPDKPVGRKQILTPCATKTWAAKNSIPFSEELNIACDLAIVADYGKIIKQEVYEKPKLGTFNIHFSKLPDLRGASPVQATLLRGDTTAWVTIFKIEKTLDTGPILDQRSFPILPDDTTQTLYIQLFTEVAKYLPDLIFSLATNRLPLTPQVGTPTYCKMLTREDGFIDWEKLQNNLDLASHDRVIQHTIYRQWQAMTPWPGLWTIKDGKRLKILKCHPAKKGLILDEIQFEGKKPQKIDPTASEISR